MSLDKNKTTGEVKAHDQMIKFRNPGSDIETQIAVFQSLYSELKDQPSFDIQDMKRVITQTRLMTAYGYGGKMAADLSSKKEPSRDSARMNAKMYAEVFRMFGWICPHVPGRSYPVRFTLAGICAAANKQAAVELVKQSLMGYVHPSENNRGVKYDEVQRFFLLTLRALDDLGGRMHKHELCIGPMSYSEDKDDGYRQMLAKIESIRGNYADLKEAFTVLAKELGMKTTSVDNMTRFPLGMLKGVGWIRTGITDRTIYNKPLKFFEITEAGKTKLEEAELMADLRLAQYQRSTDAEKEAMVRLGIFSMLDRAGFRVGSFQVRMEKDRQILSNTLEGKDLLFSPYQTVSPKDVETALRRVDINYAPRAVEAEMPSAISTNRLLKQSNEYVVTKLGRVSYMRNQTRIAASTTPARYVTASLS